MNYIPGTNLYAATVYLLYAKLAGFSSYILPFGAELESQLFNLGFKVRTIKGKGANGLTSNEYYTLVSLDV
jgi:hypothetical protein